MIRVFSVLMHGSPEHQKNDQPPEQQAIQQHAPVHDPVQIPAEHGVEMDRWPQPEINEPNKQEKGDEGLLQNLINATQRPERSPPAWAYLFKPEPHDRQGIGKRDQDRPDVMKNEVLAPMDEEHVLRVVIEARLHHRIANDYTQGERKDPQRARPILIRHPKQSDAIKPHNEHVAQHGQRREIIG